MTTREHIRLANYLLRKLALVFIIGPATIVGALLFLGWLAGGSPSRNMASGLYEWAEASFRSVPADQVVQRHCATQPLTPQMQDCPRWISETVSKAEFIDRTADEIIRWYLWLVKATVLMLTLQAGVRYAVSGFGSPGEPQAEAQP